MLGHPGMVESIAISGRGFTVMVYETGTPVQAFADGVTVMVAEIAPVPVFVAVKAGISPVPLAARPIAVLEFVQVKAVPVTEPVNVSGPIVAPVQAEMSAGSVTAGNGFTVMV